MRLDENTFEEDYKDVLAQIEANSDYGRLRSREKKYMTAAEMGELLGLKKTDRYWLLHQHHFEWEEVLGLFRINIPSFEKWYANQVKYKKVNGEEPGKELKEWSFSPQEIAEEFGINTCCVYEKQIEKRMLPLKMLLYPCRRWHKFYQSMSQMAGHINPISKKGNKYISPSTIRDVHKLLRSAFQQAVKWELMDKNPAAFATTPKCKRKERDIWTAETVMYALEVCEDERLKLAISLAFSCSLRLGELLGLTWDCIDISEETIALNKAYVFINKEAQRVDKEALIELDGKDVMTVFPERCKTNKTILVLKTPKTESSVRKVFLPRTVAYQLIDWKKEQDKLRDVLGSEYTDYNLVMATTYGLPIGNGAIRKSFNKLIQEHNLPPVVFHSLRHTSVTYKLKLNGGDIKAVQGDSGHSQINMVTDVYSHIIDDDRRRNAEMFEDAFYGKKDLDPQLRKNEGGENVMTVPEGVDAELLAKVLANPEMAALLTSLAKTMK